MAVKKKQKHRWDETLVIAVMVVAILGVLILLAGRVGSTGHAVLTQTNLVTDTIVVFGSEARCNQACAQREYSCVLAYDGNVLTTCGAAIEGEYQCVCAGTK